MPIKIKIEKTVLLPVVKLFLKNETFLTMLKFGLFKFFHCDSSTKERSTIPKCSTWTRWLRKITELLY